MTRFDKITPLLKNRMFVSLQEYIDEEIQIYYRKLASAPLEEVPRLQGVILGLEKIRKLNDIIKEQK